jgi:hypothetical protein
VPGLRLASPTSGYAAGVLTSTRNGFEPGGLPGLVPGAEEQRRARVVLLGIAVGWVVLHAVWAGLDRPINWDEAIHFTQVARGRSTIFLEPHRTRGVSLLVAPIGVFDPSMAVLRGYVAVLGGLGIFAAFATWIRTIGYAAPLGAALFSSYGVTVFYGAEVLPNLPTALGCVAIAGLTAQIANSDQPIAARQLWIAAAIMAFLALVRPPDAVIVGVGIAGAVMLLRPKATWPFTAAAAAGGAAGLLPWFAEGAARFGFGPVELVSSGGDYGANAEPINRLPIYIRFLEGQYRCSPSCERDLLAEGSLWASPGWRSLSFLAVCAGLVVVAAFYAGHRRRAALVAGVAGAPLLVFYVTTSMVNQRYILPAIALWLLVPAIGAVAGWAAVAGLPRADLLRSLGAVLLILALAWQWNMGADRLRNGMGSREEARQLGLKLGDVANDEPCAVATTDARPMIQYWSGCEAVTLASGPDMIQDPLGELDSYVDLAALQQAGYRVFALTEGVVGDDSPVAAWSARPLEGGATEGWTLYEYRSGDPLPAPPCPPDDGPQRRLGGVLSEQC